MEFINLDKLSEDVKKKVVPYCNSILTILGDNLRSIVIYGSASSGEYIPGKSDINLLFVGKRFGLDVFKALEKVVIKGIKRRISTPLFFTPEHIKTSKDVFPIEFLEMSDNHITIYGGDIFEDLQINDEHLRLECEEQIKRKLIRTRQAWFEVAGRKGKVASLLYVSLVSVIPSIRGIIRLQGEAPPPAKNEVIDRASEVLAIDLDVFKEILKIKRTGKILDVESIFERYLEVLSTLANYVDKM